MNFPSNDSDNVNNSVHQDVRVKIEPGTSTSESSDSGILKNIKVEPGLPNPSHRLTSFRPMRDLTLGGNVKTEKPKRTYTPNLNAQRNKKKDEPVTSRVEPMKSRDSGFRDRGRGQNRGDRARGRGNVVQSVGVWSEGVNVPIGNRRSGSSGNRITSARKYLDKPKIDLNKIVNKMEEEKLKNLYLGDDFGDNMDPDAKIDYIMLPMKEDYVKKSYKEEIKAEINSCAAESEVDRKPIITENGEVKNVKREQKIKTEMLTEKEEFEESNKRVHEMIENQSNSYILMHFPTSLPGLISNDDKDEPESNRSNDSRLTISANDKKKVCCTLSDIKSSGLIGKLQILKSGKVRLQIGKNYFSVFDDAHYNSLQHVLAANLDTMSLTGEFVNLGPIKDSLSCTIHVDHTST